MSPNWPFASPWRCTLTRNEPTLRDWKLEVSLLQTKILLHDSGLWFLGQLQADTAAVGRHRCSPAWTRLCLRSRASLPAPVVRRPLGSCPPCDLHEGLIRVTGNTCEAVCAESSGWAWVTSQERICWDWLWNPRRSSQTVTAVRELHIFFFFFLSEMHSVGGGKSAKLPLSVFCCVDKVERLARRFLLIPLKAWLLLSVNALSCHIASRARLCRLKNVSS